MLVSECHLLDNLLDFCLLFRRLRCPQYVRDLGGGLFILLFSFGYKELKVRREYTVNVFNGFINA